MRQIFERVRAAYGMCKGTWIAADFEAWERDHSIITEFGFTELKWSTVSGVEEQLDSNTNSTAAETRPKGSERVEPVITRSGHWIVKENQSYRNGEFCQD